MLLHSPGGLQISVCFLMNSKAIRKTGIVCSLISSVFVMMSSFYTSHLSLDSDISKRKQSLFLLETKQDFFVSQIHDIYSNVSRKQNFAVTMNDTINYTINNITKDTTYKFTNHTKNNPPLSIYVVSLQGVTGANPENKGRLDNFIQAFRERCGVQTQIRVCQGELDHRRGYGLTRTYVKCLQQAIDDDDDYSIFLEDDARLKTSELCDSSYRDSIWSEARSDVLLLLLGGHDMKYSHMSWKKIRPLTYSLGTYAFMVPHENLILLRDHFSSELVRGKVILSPDISWYNLASHVKKKIYITSPNVIRHSKGFSNTWNRSRGEILR